MPYLGGEATLSDHWLSLESGNRQSTMLREVPTGRHRDMTGAMFRMEMDIDFRVLRAATETSSLGKGRCCLRGSLSRAKRKRWRHKLRQVKATGWSMLVKFCGFFATRLRRFFGRDLSDLLFLPKEEAA